MHFCKNFFIRDRLELSNERLSQNLENLYKKKKFAATRIHFRVTNHETYLIIALPRYFKILVTIQDYVLDVDGCFGVRVCVCVCIFLSVCKNPYFWFQPTDLYKGKKKEASPMNFMGFEKSWGFWKWILCIIFTSSEYLLSHFHVLQ